MESAELTSQIYIDVYVQKSLLAHSVLPLLRQGLIKAAAMFIRLR